MQMSKELLETMYSGQDYESEVALNMTGLAALLQTVQDVVITVNFKKQVSSEDALFRLMNSDASSFTDGAKRAKLARQLLQGEDCSLTCHVVQTMNNLGRSLVIDLKAERDNNYR